MVLYRCQRCLKEFNKKSNYITHCNKKNQCIERAKINIFAQIPENAAQNPEKNSAEYKCGHCHKCYLNKYTLQRHLRDYCKELKKKTLSETIKLKNEMIDMKHEIKEMSKEIKQLRTENNQLIALTNAHQQTIHGNHNTVNSNNTTNNTTNNVFITIPFGNEDYKRLTEEDRIRIINHGKDAILECFKLIHFNKSIPEFQNIKHTDLSSNTVTIVGENNQLESRSIDEVVHTSFDNTWNFVDNISMRSDKKFLNKCDKEWSKETQDHMKDLRFVPTKRNREKEKIKGCMIGNTKN